MGSSIKVFLASPGDVIEERMAVRAIIEEENHNHFKPAGYNLEVVGWETHASPGKGQPHPQGRINPLIDDCALFIGILWARFGSPTGRSESGTQEEYEYALSLLASPDLPLCDIKIYFCDYSLKPSEIDLEQFGKVQEFKRKLEGRGQIFHWTVETSELFKRDFRRHISEWFREYRERGGGKRLSIKNGKGKSKSSEESLSLRFRSITKGF
ncbi:DUF4062 domain-containing protein [Chloroflexota bacterium]